ncbi:selenium cofactor biosynthesis protein YqeC [Haloarchaeobius sp. DYHT-AS-18]|uniref:selenium cofactor biosynthesis protein YqeC n=1 Tax=Haloarchaeobius sp. DYHT-AS-18 TaxID=3446117 RepID=UPI003EC099AA
MQLTEAVPSEGTVCVVGAGGKKSLLYTLARDLHEAVVTATVRIPIFDGHVGRVVATEDPVAALAEADDEDWPLGLVLEQEREDRYRGYDTATVAELAEAADVPVLVKADGARGKLFKAPGDLEPAIPENADAVCPVVSVQIVGQALSDLVVHRPESVVDITNMRIGGVIKTRHVAQVLTDPEGGLKNVPDDATVVPVLNMVDDDDLEATARQIAAEIHDRSDRIDRVVLTCLADEDDPVVDVI